MTVMVNKIVSLINFSCETWLWNHHASIVSFLDLEIKSSEGSVILILIK